MTQDEAATHWQKRAHAELKAARILFEKEELDVYGEVLFHCHLALELALKAAFIRKEDTAAPFTHDLNELADAMQIIRTQDERDEFEEITECAILSRYGDEAWHGQRQRKKMCRNGCRRLRNSFQYFFHHEAARSSRIGKEV